MNAVIFTDGLLDQRVAKTAHGLLRGTDRYNIVGVIDARHAGKDAGEVLDGVPRGVPVYRDIDECLTKTHEKPNVLIIGIATKGGVLPPEMKATLHSAIEHGLGIVSGLHDLLEHDAELSATAAQKGVDLVDIRRPKPFQALHFWTGDIATVACPRVAVLGTDCAVGKRTTGRRLVEACRKTNLSAEMIYTGQTGWMLGFPYGFIFDATPNDFVSGELEHAIVHCAKDAKPDVIFLEGQSSLRNPSGPCGAEFLLSGMSSCVVLQHDPAREFFVGFETLGLRVPTPADEIELIRQYGVATIALTLNPSHLDRAALERYKDEWSEKLDIPVLEPLTDDLSPILDAIHRLRPGIAPE